MSDTSPSVPRWLTLIGIGEDGPDGLGEEAKRLIAAAPAVFGGARHLELAGTLITGERFAWQSPFEQSVEAIEARRGTPVVVLASGDPFLYGVGATLSRRIAAQEMRTIPAPSAFSLAAARLGWPLQEAACVSLHGRPLDLIRPHLHVGRHILALTSDEEGPQALADLLVDSGFAETRLTVLEALGGGRERIRSTTASGFDLNSIDPLNVCALEIAAGPGARILPYASGLDDALFEHDGQITKREIRAVTLSALSPRHGELLWDIGAGSGSVGIEWMLADPSLKTIAIEQAPERAALIARNAASFGVPQLALVEGTAPEALAGLPAPDVIFIGGGGSEAGVMDAAIAALKRGGRLVANAVTLEMEAVLLAEYRARGGALTKIEITRAAPVGGMSGWRPAMPVTQWRWVKE
ncbi:precorrin-6y C5,15-methyltransferase (decarboxylating) subunit CbiE [Rhizobium mesosinicum]|uniref:Precorrin-6y C5,15-methyltransferase (Decarboxylating) subunit CbiE n=1 Tax=Rhizobium mesosinicum TaxID=335017 RepID=A0ABS7GNH8_9HYPH|nr:precorrin-6y C5,15-methyltransferase (decarboxylating) subunit CbiE [Rhizobium mesosinicum]MBW9051484.1 precorrin-6y C5,15-methyltransferase (decarboxylating) subunit CbiE [Rhizobium mesosinicum]